MKRFLPEIVVTEWVPLWNVELLVIWEKWLISNHLHVYLHICIHTYYAYRFEIYTSSVPISIYYKLQLKYIRRLCYYIKMFPHILHILHLICLISVLHHMIWFWGYANNDNDTFLLSLIPLIKYSMITRSPIICS